MTVRITCAFFELVGLTSKEVTGVHVADNRLVVHSDSGYKHHYVNMYCPKNKLPTTLITAPDLDARSIV